MIFLGSGFPGSLLHNVEVADVSSKSASGITPTERLIGKRKSSAAHHGSKQGHRDFA
jgi:hypothetical protein